jgi:amino acid permease
MLFGMFFFVKVIISIVGIFLLLVIWSLYCIWTEKSNFTSLWRNMINKTHHYETEKSRKTSDNRWKVAKDGKVFDTDFEETDDK